MKARHAMWSKHWSAFGAALLLLLGWTVGCGAVRSESSGETHFLVTCGPGTCDDGFECLCGACTRTCTTDASCGNLPGLAACVQQPDGCGAPVTCDVECASDADCNGVSARHRCVDGACRAGTPPATTGCAAGCDTVYGYPEDPGRGVDLSRQVALGCACGTEPDLVHCVRRTDGRLLLVEWPDFQPSEPLAECSAEEAERLSASSDFASCALRPSAVCSKEDYCTHVECGGPQYDENGCARKSCKGDADCSADEACTRVESPDQQFCYMTANGCQCASLTNIPPPASFCAPRPPLGELCDGSNTVRLMEHAGGGFLADGQDFLEPYGSSVFIVLGTCDYYAQGNSPSEWRTGHLSDAEAESIANAVQYQRMPEFGTYRDNESCPDAGSQYLQAPGSWTMCTCGCGDDAPDGLTMALGAASDAAEMYGTAGPAMTGGAVSVVALPEDRVGEAAPAETRAWPLDVALADLVPASQGALMPDDGTRITAADDVAALRALRTSGGDGLFTFVHDADGAVYGVLVRDELPDDVAAAVDALVAELSDQ